MTKFIFATVIGVGVLIFGIFAVLFGIATLDPSSFFDTASASANATQTLEDNFTGGIASFSQRLPTMFIVLGVVLVLAVILILVAYVKRMDSGGGGGGL